MDTRLRSTLSPLIALPLLLACAGEATEEANDTSSSEAAADATQPEGPDIWLANLSWTDGRPVFADVRNATRRAGYDNQPHFFPDGSVFYTSQEGERTDIWRLNPADGSTAPVTRTDPESEYSPTATPDGMGFTAIRVEADSVQRLWRFNMDGSEVGPVFESVAPVGYHAWADDQTIGMFVLGQPATFQIGMDGTDGATTLVEGIGRSLNAVPGRDAITFPRSMPGDAPSEIWMFEAGDTRFLVESLDSQDHAWGNGVIFQAEGSTIYTWDPERPDAGWVPAIDLSDQNLDITRMTVRADGGMIAFVAEVDAG